jgi:hemerythrin-like domain-containing protein
MNSPTATDVIRSEHEIIRVLLEGADREVRSIQQTGKVNSEKLRRFLEFVDQFIEGFHLAKEGTHLIPLLKQRGEGMASDLSEELLREHRQGRTMIMVLAATLARVEEDPELAVSATGETLAVYARLWRNHIWKENEILLPIAERLLTAEDQQRLAEEFAKTESGDSGPGLLEHYRRLAHELAEN